jgi:hypothetical protein
MHIEPQGAVILAIGILMVIFSKQIAKAIVWFHQIRAKHKKIELPMSGWADGSNFVRIFTVVVGGVLTGSGILIFFNILKMKQ